MFFKNFICVTLVISLSYATFDAIKEEKLLDISQRMRGMKVDKNTFVSKIKGFLSSAPYTTNDMESELGPKVTTLLTLIHEQFDDLLSAVYFVSNNVFNTFGYRFLIQHPRYRPVNEVYYGRGILMAQGEPSYNCASEKVSSNFVVEPDKLATLSEDAVSGSINLYKTITNIYLAGRPESSLTFKDTVKMVTSHDTASDEEEASLWKYDTRKRIFLRLASLFISID